MMSKPWLCTTCVKRRRCLKHFIVWLLGIARYVHSTNCYEPDWKPTYKQEPLADYQRKGKTMKKLFVSVPMKGRTEDEIKASIQKMKKIAEIYEGEELELIDSYIEDNPPKGSKEAIWFLGESIKKLAKADVFVGIQGHYEWSGCHVEFITAQAYGIKSYAIPESYVIDNYNALLRKLHLVCNEAMPTI